jgi:hypothetical protein
MCWDACVLEHEVETYDPSPILLYVCSPQSAGRRVQERLFHLREYRKGNRASTGVPKGKPREHRKQYRKAAARPRLGLTPQRRGSKPEVKCRNELNYI